MTATPLYFNRIEKSEAGDELKKKLTDLTETVLKLCKELSPEEGEQVARDVESFATEATSPKPRRKFLEFVGEGLTAAANIVKQYGPPVTALVGGILAIL